jgi:hypothetical protein
MGADDAYPAEMPDHPPRQPDPLDDDTAERLLDGRVDPEDAPPGYAEVAALLRAATAPAEPDELAGQPAAMAAFRAAGGRPARRRRRRVLVAAVAIAGALFAGGAAAATGALPAAAERVARIGGVGGQAPAGPVRVLPPARPTSPPSAAITGRRSAATPSTGPIAPPARRGPHAAKPARPGHRNGQGEGDEGRDEQRDDERGGGQAGDDRGGDEGEGDEGEGD